MQRFYQRDAASTKLWFLKSDARTHRTPKLRETAIPSTESAYLRNVEVNGK
jgi:hypothetical protein